MQLRPLDQQTLVITGATSGIGLATALMAAERGARLLLVARAPDDLAAAAERCRDAGGPGTRVETVAADVADKATLDLVVQRAKEAFGGFDTWVNNAGVSVYGRLEDIPMEDARRCSRRTTGAPCMAASPPCGTSASAGRPAEPAWRSSTSARC